MLEKLKILKKRKVFIPALLVLAAVIFTAFTIGSSQDEAIETVAAQKIDVIQKVTETGTVEPAKAVELSFGAGGQVETVFIEEGDSVENGQSLATIMGAEAALMQSARANYNAEQLLLDELLAGARDVDERVSEANLRLAESTLRNTISTQDQLVENARKQLFSNDLRAYLSDGGSEGTNDSFVPPTITGTYIGKEEGEIVVDLYSSDTQSGYSFELSGIENGLGSVSTTGPEPLGDTGLFIQFPDDFANNRTLEWVIPIPNTRSATYVQVMNAYKSALETRDSSIDGAEKALELAQAQSEQTLASATPASLQAQSARVLQAQAALKQAEVAYKNSVITAPFNGVVTEVSFSEYEYVAPGTGTISLMSEEDFEIKLNISESDIGFVEIGDSAQITLEAYEDLIIPAKVVSISPRASVVEGVTVVPITLQFSDPSGLIRPGLSADVEIYTESRNDVLAVPARAIIEENGETYVRVSSDNSGSIESIKMVPVKTGIRGSDAMIEIQSGLEVGDAVVTFVPAPLRQVLEENESIKNQE